MQDSKPVTTAAVPHTSLTADSDSEPVDTTDFRAMVGALQYLASCTRPDISYAVSQLARHQVSPRADHLIAAKRVLRYLKGTVERGIHYHPDGNNHIIAFADASYANDNDTRRSTSGWAAFLNGAAVAWGSKRQATVATSSAEAEYIALATASMEVMHLRSLLGEIDFPQPTTTIYEDNAACTFMARNPVTKSTARHIDIKLHFIRERIASGEINVQYLPTNVMVADALTKALDKGKFEEHTARMHGEQPFSG